MLQHFCLISSKSPALCCDPLSRSSQKHCYFKVPQVGPDLQAQGEMPEMCAMGGRLRMGQLFKALRRDGGRRRGVCGECVKDPIGSAAAAQWSTRNMQTQICNSTPALFMWRRSKINDHFAGGCGRQTGKQLPRSQ